MQLLLGHKIFRLWALLAHVVFSMAMLWPLDKLPDVAYSFPDKWSHFAVFSTLYLLWAFALESKWSLIKLRLRLCFGLVIYGIIIELIQYKWLITRHGDLMDLVANTGGILFGLILYHVRSNFNR